MRGAPLGRALIVALALGGAFAAPVCQATATASPCSQSNACLAVHLPDGSVDYIDIPELRAEAAAAQGQSNGVPNETSYPERLPNGSDADLSVVDALSVNALIAPLLSGLDPPVPMSAVTFTDMPKPGEATWSILSAPELSARPSAFADPTLLPAYYSAPGTNAIWYVRPLRNATDSNTDDNAVSTSTPANGELDLYVHTGPLLTVTASASVVPPKTAKIGQPIRFTASSTGTSATVSYVWTVDGAQVPSQQSLTYSFPAAGSYEIQVTATGADDSAGTATPIYLTVGTSHFSGTPSPGTSPSRPPTATPTATPRPSVAPLPTVTPRAPAVTTESPSTGASSGHAGGSGTATHSPGPTPSAPPRATDRLTLVHGQLIGQSAALLAAPGAVAERSTAGVAAAGRLSFGWRATGFVGAIAAIMLLFGAGAARELRGARRGRSAVTSR